jgi:IS30 family transposase
MGLPKSYSAVILGKHPSNVYRELGRNSSGGVYTGNEAHKASVQRRLDNKPSPKLDDPALAREIMRLFKQDRSADQISGRLAALRPEQPGKQASTSTIYACLSGETAKNPVLQEHFRQKQASGRGQKTAVGKYLTLSVSTNDRKSLRKSPALAIGRATP